MKYINIYKIAASMVAGLWLMTSSASASLIGDEVSCNMDPGSWSCNTATAIVGAGAEFELVLGSAGAFFNVDLDASSITLNYVSSGNLGAGAGEFLTLSDLDWVGMAGEIVGIENFFASTTTGVEEADVSFTADSVMIDLNNTNWNTNLQQMVSFDLVTRYSAIPEPSAIALLGLGLMGLGFARRRRT